MIMEINNTATLRFTCVALKFLLSAYDDKNRFKYNHMVVYMII